MTRQSMNAFSGCRLMNTIGVHYSKIPVKSRGAGAAA